MLAPETRGRWEVRWRAATAPEGMCLGRSRRLLEPLPPKG
ncbi:hypothetical protein A176_006317 [Myxococcus hansupus]|uniref:Uncharacterized protein n=1 Tax=Pseudomyxococcus hansupus TaxID=1297742 RepID=A0A0H4X727_9BACT|nr:hypothetical protein A176_006317 [Myxococcus hansupus]